jgi:methyl-accepting chemotaxis protein
MTEGTLFNSGFLGENFNWWIGQIADDSYWRDNIIPGKFEDKNSIPGWGRRYKVRIIGLHDQEEESISSDQLPWAQIMYPVTAGGGQGNTFATSGLRQGNFVFGFFLDGADQQVPVIMGVLGNNAQTSLGNKIGTTKTNFTPISGYAQGNNTDSNSKVPAAGLGVSKPGSKPSNPKSNVILDKFGRDPSRPPTKREFAAAQSARAEAAERGLSKEATEALVAERTVAATKAEAAESRSPIAPAQSGATIEQPDNPHLMSVADVQRNNMYQEKIVILNPCDLVGSAMKAIQTEIDNLTKQIDSVLQEAQSYIDAASSMIGQIQKLIADVACVIAKYLKIIFDQILEYILKQINCALEKATDAIPPNLRFKFFDIREKITELIYCLFSKITNNLCGQIQGLLNDQTGTGDGTGDISKSILDTTTVIPNGYTTVTPICSVEILTGQMIALNIPQIVEGIDTSLNSVSNFLEDNQSFISEISGTISDIAGLLEETSSVLGSFSGNVPSVSEIVGGLTGSLSAGMNFTNLTVNIFGCDLGLNCPASDYYTLQEGSGGSEQAQLPRIPTAASAAQSPVSGKTIEEVPYVTPTRENKTVDYRDYN